MDISFNGKDTKNFTDRKSLLIVAKWFSDNLPKHFFLPKFYFQCALYKQSPTIQNNKCTNH